MTVLQRKCFIPADVDGADRLDSHLPEKVIQFGDGRFIRAFVDWQIDKMNSRGLFGGSVVIVKNRPGGDSMDRLNDQEGLFSVLMQGYDNGTLVRKTRIITTVSRGINPYGEWDAFLACAENPELRIAVSNTTEVGLTYQPEAASEGPKNSFPANLTAFLHHRYLHFSGSPERGLIFLPTELLEDNGAKLQAAVLAHAKNWQLSEGFLAWLQQANYFLNTLVDRIVTSCSEEHKAELFRQLGVNDRLPVCGEPYHLWAIEGPPHLEKEFPLRQAGLNVFWEQDITRYRVLKMRILNGSHTLVAPIALLLGQKMVRESLNDPDVFAFLKKAMMDEIVPTLGIPLPEAKQFAAVVLERLQNPFIDHMWLDILTGTTAKFTARIVPTLKTYIKDRQLLPAAIVFSLAALLLLYKTTVRESDDVKKFFTDLWQQESEAALVVDGALANQSLWQEDLRSIDGLTEQVTAAMQCIKDLGIRVALEKVVIQ